MSNINAKSLARGGFSGGYLGNVRAVEFIRKMRGGAQTAMFRCSDGRHYIVKMMGNPQGTNVLGNEHLATVLASIVDIPVPSFSNVLIAKSVIDSTPAMWFSVNGVVTRPMPGLHFGSLLVGDSFGLKWPTERLSSSHFPYISNRTRFVDALVFDVWANNQDNRQAIFTEGPPTPTNRSARAYFIDHGYAFGGSEGLFDERLMRGFYVDLSVYEGLDLSKIIESAIDRFRTRIPRLLGSALSEVPLGWYSFDQKVLQDTLMDRLSRLEELIDPVYAKLLKT